MIIMSAPKAHTSPMKAVLIDISGTILIGEHAIPGAIDAIHKLQQQPNVKVLFLTNSSTSSISLLEQLRKSGFDELAIPNINSIMTSVSATRNYLIQNNLRPYCLMEDTLVETDFVGVDRNEPNCVVVGLARSKLNYEKLNVAFRLLTKLKKADVESDTTISTPPPPRLIAISRATHFLDSDHELSLGPGGFVTLLEQTVGVTAHVIGKPSPNFYQAAVSSLLGIEYDPSSAVMIGDDVKGDVSGALEAGLGCAILVKTGKYVTGDELGTKTGGILPSFTAESIVEAVDYICSNMHG